jgi:hypothetical protein
MSARHTINTDAATSRRGMLVLLSMLVFGALGTLWAVRGQMLARYTVDVVGATHRCTFYFDPRGKKNGESISTDCTSVPVSRRVPGRPHVAVMQGMDLSVRLAVPGGVDAVGTLFKQGEDAEHAIAVGKTLAVLYPDGTLGFGVPARPGLIVLALYVGVVLMLFTWGLRDTLPRPHPESVAKATPRFGRRIDTTLHH